MTATFSMGTTVSAQPPPTPDPVMLDDGGTGEYFNSIAKSRQLARLSAAEQASAVDLGSRIIVPTLNASIEFNGVRQRLYVQFTRPLTATERGDVIRLGVHFHESVGNGTYLVTLSEEAYEALKNYPLVKGFESMQYVDKLTRQVYSGSGALHAVRADGKWAVHIRFFDTVSLEQALQLLDQNGIEVPDRSRFLLDTRLEARATQSVLHAIADSSLVREIVPVPAPPQDDNVNAAAMSNINVLQAPPFNLLGTGVNMGQWEGGQVLSTHVDMTGRVTLVEVGSPGDHATHVAGTMIGNGSNNANALGMAPAANLFSWINNGDVPTEMADGVTNQGISTANHSWGISNTNGVPEPDQSIFGRYDGSARGWDVAIFDSGLIVCNSSGNDNLDTDGIISDGITGDDDGLQYHTIDSAGNAKNNITCGNLSDDASNIVGSSSTGPTDDGRIKPNVVANGQSLTSTSYDSTNPGNNAFYESMGGTSMATPTIAGACALLVERWRNNNAAANPWPDTIKALLIHTATDLGIIGPDNIYGYGLINAETALSVLDSADTQVILESADQDETDEFKVPVAPGTSSLRVTAVWTDPPGAVNSDPSLINNLNLELEGPDGVIYYPFTGASAGGAPTNANVDDLATTSGPNNVDNVEQVLVPLPVQGFWTARITGANVPDGPQNYTLVSNIGFALPDQPNISVNAPLTFDEICLSRKQDIRISVFNTGGSALEVDSVAVTSGGPEFLVLANPVQPFVVIPGSHVDLTVRFSPTTPGLKNGVLTIASNDPDTPSLEISIFGIGGSGDAIASIANSGSFGTVCPGSFLDLPLTISNNGACPLTITGVVSDNAEFIAPSGENEISVATPRVIAPGDSLQVPIRFQPTLPFGAKNGNITITTDDPDPSQINLIRAVSGVSGAGDIAASIANSGSFGNVCEGSILDLPLTISNNGSCPLTITGVTSDNAEFITPTGENEISVANPRIIAAGDSIQVPIRFQPVLPFGAKSGNITITSDDPDPLQTTLVRAVSGTYPEPVLDLNPCPIEFGEVCLTDASQLIKTVNICNTGLCPLTIPTDGIRFTAPTSDFEIVNTPTYPLTISPGSECYPLAIKFTPTSPGLKTATLIVEAEGGISKTCEVSGSTADLNDALKVPEKLAFVPTVIQPNGPCGSSLPLPIENISNRCPVQISELTITGPDAALFTVEGLPALDAVPVSIGPGEMLGDGNCTVKFQPTELVTKRFLSADLNITFVTDPTVDPPVTVTRTIPMCGEAVQSGLRILVTVGGVPVDSVQNLSVRKLRGRQVVNSRNVPLKKVIGTADFVDEHSFDYHLECGGVSSPNQRLTGNHQIVARVKIGRRSYTRKVNLNVDSCTFNDTLIINF